MMSETHPEELLDALRDGTLGSTDRARLEEHAAGCAACRLEMGVTAEAQAELSPRPDDEIKMGAMVGAAMAQVDLPAEGSATGGVGSMQSLIIAAGVVGVVVLAMVTGGPGQEAPPEPAPLVSPVPTEGPASQTPLPPEPRPEHEPEAGAAGIQPESDSARPPETEEPVEVEDTPPKAGSGPSAAELLERANEARRAKDYEKAARLYAQLGREHRGTDEEVLSRVTYGRVLLDHQARPKQALRRFDAYLEARPDGTLAEEALMGRAKALGRLGRENEERAAWQRLLDRFPNSAYAALAKQKLGG